MGGSRHVVYMSWVFRWFFPCVATLLGTSFFLPGKGTSSLQPSWKGIWVTWNISKYQCDHVSFYGESSHKMLIPAVRNSSEMAWICMFDAWQKSKSHIFPIGAFSLVMNPFCTIGVFQKSPSKKIPRKSPSVRQKNQIKTHFSFIDDEISILWIQESRIRWFCSVGVGQPIGRDI